MLSLILFLIILGTIVLIHEFGHFIFSKIFGVYVYEYSIGMGPKLWSKKPKKSETEYSIRAIPIGGFVRLAGEEGEDGDKTVPKNRKLYNKGFLQRFLIFFMGPGFNFLLAVVTLFVSCVIFGGMLTTTKLDNITDEYPAYAAGLRNGDTLIEVQGERVYSWTQARLKIATAKEGKAIKFTVKDDSGNTKKVSVTPKKIEDKKGNVSYVYGVGCKIEKLKGLGGSIKYSILQTKEMLITMYETLKYLFTGKLGVNDLSGPVGVYEIVDKESQSGVSNLLYLLAFLSVNVGVINLIPFPAFDGGHILFLIIEKIRRKPVDANIEATITGIGFVCLMLMMIYITFHDVLNLIH
ncbi:MAG: RIP metalloprotease RseP [Bacilli bacterium]|nr:RIP metalloprotease RseP [Bacilli bacterium]